MGVRFVLGRAGSGKTKHCFDSIVAAMREQALGPSIYWILPKQGTFSAERELTTLSGLDAFCRARVLSFDLLGEEVLEGCGGAAVPLVNSIGRQMLLGFLLRKNQDALRYFRSVARQPGLAARLDATFAEFERCGKDAAALEALLHELEDTRTDPGGVLLREKIADFYLLYRAYREELGNDRVDPHRRLEQVLACMTEHKLLRGASVYVDGFLEFTDRERRMIAALGKVCSRVDVTLLIDPASPTITNPHHLPDELSLFYRTETTYRSLALLLEEQEVAVERPLVLKESKRFAAPALARIERDWFGKSQEKIEESGAIELVQAPDPRCEVDVAARRIRLLLQQGFRLRDIAILVRDIEAYEPLISASFREHEIVYYVDRRMAAAHHPLIQCLRSLLTIARQNWPHDAVMSLLKSGLAGVSLEEAEELENYVLLHRIKGLAWAQREPWNFERRLVRDEADDLEVPFAHDSARMNGVRRELVRKIGPFVAAADRVRSVHEIVIELFQVLNELGVAKTLESWIEKAIERNEPAQRGEHEQVWAELVELFDQMVDLLGEQEVSLADFVEILEAGLEQFDLALPPPRIDQVLVGQIDRTRTTRTKVAIVLGLSEGQFPRIAREESVLSDAERKSLRQRKLEVDPDSERRLLDENLLGYVAFTRASDKLIVTRPASIDGKPIEGSAFWSRLRRMFADLPIVEEKREDQSSADAIGTPRQLITGLMRWARSSEASADKQQPWAGLYQWLVEHPCGDDAIDVMRFRAWRALDYRNEAALSAEVAKNLVGETFSASVTRIESFATCPFKHFARSHLGLEEREEAEVTPMDLGTVYHHILEGVVRQTLAARQDWCEVEKKVTAQMIGNLAEEAGKALRGELMLSTARNKYLLARIRKNLAQVCANQQRVLSRGGFRPEFAELEFGMREDCDVPALLLKTPRGHTVELRGKIDRVDLLRAAKTSAKPQAAIVVDYKMRQDRLPLHEVYHGLSLQLLTYLLVLEASGEKLFGKKVTPVAAFYAKLLRGLESVDHPEQAIDDSDPLFDLRVKPRGIFDGNYVHDLDAQLQSGASEVVSAYVNQDGRFGRIDSSDVAASHEFTAILSYVRKKIGELADRMIDGVIEAKPYRIGKDTPCSNCEYRGVCRFDPAINSYLMLAPMKRSEVLAKLVEEAR